jgi:signal transduction histidine kinase
VPRWLDGDLAWALTIEFLAVLIGGVILWRYGDDNPRLGALALITSLGIVCLFSLMQFGPLMGLGFLAFAWLIGMTSLLGRGWLAASFTVLGVILVATMTQFGWDPDWAVEMSLREWTRTTVAVAITSFAGASVVERMNAELLSAWSQERAAEQERAEAERALLQAQRLESIARLAGGVAHDFNNALAVLVAGTEVLDRTDGEAERRDILKNMGQAARGAVATTKQLLSLSRQGLEPGKPANPKTALEALIPNLERLFPETIEIRSTLEDTAHVPLSSGDLEQVVLNLCLNARDGMPKGGVLEISCCARGEDVIVQVRDSGEGMDEATLSQAMVKETLDTVAGTLEVALPVRRRYHHHFGVAGPRSGGTSRHAGRNQISRDADAGWQAHPVGGRQ